MDSLVESKFLSWFEIGDANAEKTVTITRAETRNEFSPFANKEQKTGILILREFPKGMIVNKKNYTALCKLLGVDWSKWAGKRITLVVKEEKVKGEAINVIRLSKVLPPQETAQEAAKRKADMAQKSAEVFGRDYAEEIKAATSQAELNAIWAAMPQPDKYAHKDAVKARQEAIKAAQLQNGE